MGVGLPGPAALVAGQGDLLAVLDQIGRVERVRVDLIVVAEKRVEAVFFRDTCGSSAAGAPLAEAACGVPALLEHRGDGRLFGSQWCASVIDANRRMAHVFSGHKSTA